MKKRQRLLAALTAAGMTAAAVPAVAVFAEDYNPTKTLFLRKALAQGKVAKGGAAMLVLQAVRAHEIWNGDSYTDKQIESIICDMEERIDEQNQTK